MPEKPRNASGYAPEHLELLRSTCLHVATKLGARMDELVVVSGRQPTLPEDRGGRLPPPMGNPSAVKAAKILEQDSSDHDAVGPRRVAEFLTGGPDDAIQADAVGFVGELLSLLQEG
jgi:hypothetical protein